MSGEERPFNARILAIAEIIRKFKISKHPVYIRGKKKLFVLGFDV